MSTDNDIQWGSDFLPQDFTRCFVCGPTNPIGLHVADIRREGDVVRATLQSRPELEGFPGLLHGGVAMTVLDEVMGYACRMMADTWAATAKFDAKFRRPMRQEGEFWAEAGLHPGTSTRRIHTWGRLLNAGGESCVEAKALFVPVSMSSFEQNQ